MSGDSHREEDLEFTDDFVLEDAADDLEVLFEDAGRPGQPGARDGIGVPEPRDEEDILFGDTSAASCADDGFAAPQQFAERSRARWGGANFSEAEIGIPVDADADAAAEPPAPEVEEDFALDGDVELELVDTESELLAEPEPAMAAADAGEGEEVTFILDESEGTAGWQDEAVPVADEGFVVDEAAAEELQPALAADDAWAPVAEDVGWAEGTAAATDEAVAAEAEATWSETEAGEPVAVGAGDEVYLEAAPQVFVGPPQRRVFRGWMLSAAAALLVVVGGMAVVLRPDWIGLRVTPELVERVQVARPTVAVAVAEPALPTEEELRVAVAPTPVVPDQPPVSPVATVPQPVAQPQPQPVDPVATVPTPAPTPPVAASAGQDPAPAPLPQPSSLLPAGDNLLVGGFEIPAGKPVDVMAIPGVVPGGRAFVQLRNGNFFIGSVKGADADVLVMRVDNGEVSLPVANLQRIAALGSAEYNDLQRATSGFIRLQNNNRLVGSILQSVMDDHVVIEMRSNRVLLPKAAVGEIVQGGNGEVFFGTGTDEDLWLRRQAEQRLRDLQAGRATGSTPR